MQLSGQFHRIGAALTLLALVACSKAPESVSEPAPPAQSAATPAAPVAPPPPILNPTEIGSQDAKDDLYCAALIIAANPQSEDAPVPVEEARLVDAQNNAIVLGLEGTGKLIDQGVALAPQTGAVADAWADIAYADFEANKPKIPLETCMARAQAVVEQDAKPADKPAQQ